MNFYARLSDLRNLVKPPIAEITSYPLAYRAGVAGGFGDPCRSTVFFQLHGVFRKKWQDIGLAPVENPGSATV